MELLSAIKGITSEDHSRPLCLRLWPEGSWQLSVIKEQPSSLAQKPKCCTCRRDMPSLLSSNLSFYFEHLTHSKLIIRFRRNNLEGGCAQQRGGVCLLRKSLTNSNYLSLRAWFLISSTSWKTRDSGERNTSTARKFFCHGETVAFTKICWM